MSRIRRYVINTVLVAFLASAPLAKASTKCDNTFLYFNLFRTFRVCISNHGNVVGFALRAQFTSQELWVPVDTIRVGVIGDGYAVCNLDSQAASYDAGFDENGWGSATVIQPGGPNTLPLTVKRTTTDGKLELTQIFSIDASRREVLDGISLRNLSTASIHLRFARYSDFDLDGTSGSDVYFRSRNSVLGVERQDAASLTSWDGAVTTVEKKTDWGYLQGIGTHVGCSPIPQPTPTAGQTGAPGPGDYVARITFDLTLASGQSKALVVAYRGE